MSEVTKRQVPGDVFFEGLSEINEGALLEALDTKMTSLVSAVLATGNNGSLTLKLSVKRKGGVNQVVIEPKVTASIPERNAIKDIADKLTKDLPENRIHRGAVCLCTKSSFTGEIDR